MPENQTETPNPLDMWRQFITDSERQWNGFFKDVLGTDGFSSAMNTWVEASLSVQRMVADQLERYYTAFNIPTHNDLVALGERMKGIEDTLARLESVIASTAVPSAVSHTMVRAKPARTKRPPATTGKPPLKEQVLHFVNKKMPGGLPKRTARALLDIEDRHYVPIIRDPVRTNSESRIAASVKILNVGLTAATTVPWADTSRTLEDLLEHAELDFMHVHEPFAPSAASAALRHSRTLNVGTFHSNTERFLSTQVPIRKRARPAKAQQEVVEEVG